MRIHAAIRPLRPRFRPSRCNPRPVPRTAFSTVADPAQAQSTINSDEIAHFSKLSALWWDEQGEFQMLHRMNPVRMKFIREKLVSASCARMPMRGMYVDLLMEARQRWHSKMTSTRRSPRRMSSVDAVSWTSDVAGACSVRCVSYHCLLYANLIARRTEPSAYGRTYTWDRCFACEHLHRVSARVHRPLARTGTRAGRHG